MIVVTGAAGFIGSCLVSKLNAEGYNDIVVVDDFSNLAKEKNLEGKIINQFVNRNNFDTWLDANHTLVQFVYHIGARTDTSEFNVEIFNQLNLDYSKMVWNKCVEYGLGLVYASSAATYGDGAFGYDDQASINTLQPLNAYGDSKQAFDLWALKQKRTPYFWVGLKFFNVYGPNEYHKGRMASVILHAFEQIKSKGKMKLFRSHNLAYKDGFQMRDFVYVKDVVNVLYFLLNNRNGANAGIYNLGSGTAAPFVELAESVFEALHLSTNIEYIDTPIDIRDKYQYFTEAKMDKLKNIGYSIPFKTLKEGAIDYVTNYLIDRKYY